jgi:hypothetical protein
MRESGMAPLSSPFPPAASVEETPAELRAQGNAAFKAGRYHDAVTLYSRCVPYSDEKVANRDTKVWHGATENGP